MLNDAVEVLDRGEMVGLPAEANGAGFDVDAFLHELRGRKPGAQVVPVYCGPTEPDPTANGARFGAKEVWVVICQARDLSTPIQEIRAELRIKGEWIKNLQKGGPSPSDLTTGKIPGASGASPTTPGAVPPGPP
jgi:hypothetical protein